MLTRKLLRAAPRQQPSICPLCSTRALIAPPRLRPLSTTASLQKPKRKPKYPNIAIDKLIKVIRKVPSKNNTSKAEGAALNHRSRRQLKKRLTRAEARDARKALRAAEKAKSKAQDAGAGEALSLKEAMLRGRSGDAAKVEEAEERPKKHKDPLASLPTETITSDSLEFKPVDHEIPPIPKLSYGLDRVLFNPGVYRLQDPRSRVYNFDPYLEKIMPATEFDYSALTEYKTSSKDKELLAITEREGTKFTGSTSSMTGALQHFHFLLSHNRPLLLSQLSRNFPLSSSSKGVTSPKSKHEPSEAALGKFSKITRGPSAIFLRRKNGIYAIDADKAYDTPNIMSWLGHSLEKLLTSSRDEFEKFRRTNTGAAPTEDDSGRCFHYSKLGNFLMRSQLDAHDTRLPGTGVFDLKTRAVVSIRMDHKQYETGAGYQLRYDQGEWESFEREFYDMTRATMLKYSLQVRMGRMDGIFVAYHNIERIFGFQYLSLSDMDRVLHGQQDTCLGDQEFKLSISLLDKLLQRSIEKYPESSIRLHFETRTEVNTPYMYVFAEPVTEEEADAIQSQKNELVKAFEREHIHGIRDEKPVLSSEQPETDSNSTPKSAASPETSATSETSESPAAAPEDPASSVPEHFTGWMLSVSSRVNDTPVTRPRKLTPEDNWELKYHIKELSPELAARRYKELTNRRKVMFSSRNEELDKQLRSYRAVIQRYSEKGRKWRLEQDEIEKVKGKVVYRPMGPGSE
ncbi:Pet127-domain-containing protein [Aaosphaeria arxii CBS 175.79]|uniref:Pet127-domain-containing protein n=1 Tax=Aaosphaeria arxii CBS 175.79 TaxID=1450172 RepID=A0A6A5XJG5_9PLEO|nr:Pet127-domain-containing protein [Aaosphaeria arxii CBS 175.79]KAF2012464.1 Pet127-domain-containing protein [Aaosphaeria arxii CBS 175.79]